MCEVLMKPWLFAVVSLALLATTGCRSDPASHLEWSCAAKKTNYPPAGDLGRVSGLRLMPGSAAGRSEPTPAEPNGASHGRGAGNGNGMAPPSIELPGQPSSGVPDS